MKKSLAILSLVGLIFASCHSTPTVNSANNTNDSINAAKHKDSMLIEMKKNMIQDSLDALKKDSTKKVDTAKAK
jgi:hypothetical protein